MYFRAYNLPKAQENNIIKQTRKEKKNIAPKYFKKHAHSHKLYLFVCFK